MGSLLEEAIKIIELAREKDLILRLAGAVAIRYHCPRFSSLHKALKRELSDLDFIAYTRDKKKVIEVFEDLGFFLQKHIARVLNRYIFNHEEKKIRADVFFDELRMSHRVPFKGRLELSYPTISLADLLLEKLQIVRLTMKDIKDVIVLLREHEINGEGQEVIDIKYIAWLLSHSWGFYYTVLTNLKKIRDMFLETIPVLKEEDKVDLKRKINLIIDRIIKEPKSIKWKLRAKIGTKKKWYEEVEDL